MLQYANDTLILSQASTHAAATLKSILDNYALTTCLTIKFLKIAYIPLHIDPSKPDNIATTMTCTLSPLPQTYLYLPLSPTKLLASAFNPIITFVHGYLQGWVAKLLS